ncbi:MAG: hypothetical protein II085_03110 [Alphaproteobacteria bacterium]|nr:hypothetical protein [Alphaproteobacteria bacterium]
MFWIINGLIYGVFTAIYTLFNQHYKLNAYLLGVWRGFGISVFFLPFCFLFPFPKSVYYWELLIAQGIMIAIYDSHLFFASAHYGAGPTSRIMALTTIITTVLWWFLTPQSFIILLNNERDVIIIMFLLLGFTASYWFMIKTPVSCRLVKYMIPAIFSLAGMSIVTKEIALHGSSVWCSLAYYLTVSTFVSGGVNFYWFYSKNHNRLINSLKQTFSPQLTKAGLYIISFSAILIIAKTLALRSAPNPGYVTALLLTSPLFVFAFNKYNKIPDNISVKAGFSMIIFLFILILTVSNNSAITD